MLYKNKPIRLIVYKIFIKFVQQAIHGKMREAINRIKVVLAEKNKTNKWLAEQLGKNYSTISKWCTNTSQPDLMTLDRIAQLLDCTKSYLLVE